MAMSLKHVQQEEKGIRTAARFAPVEMIRDSSGVPDGFQTALRAARKAQRGA
jgi:hypothetical protein